MSTPGLAEIVNTVKSNYLRQTPSRIQLVDLLVVSLFLLTVVQVAYVFVAGTSFPFNSYLAGLFSSFGSMVLAVALRIQLTNKALFDVKPERAFADFLVAMGVLQIAVFNYLG